MVSQKTYNDGKTNGGILNTKEGNKQNYNYTNE
jgi:hypothetical protein